MDRIKKGLASLASPKALLTIFVVFIFVASAIYAYQTYVKPAINPTYVDNKEYAEEGADNPVAMVYYFTADWCPVSKKAFPEWERFVGDYDGKKVNGYIVRTSVIDCEKNQEMADKYNIEGYPTVKLVYKNQVVEYDANVKYGTLVQFINTSLGDSA